MLGAAVLSTPARAPLGSSPARALPEGETSALPGCSPPHAAGKRAMAGDPLASVSLSEPRALNSEESSVEGALGVPALGARRLLTALDTPCPITSRFLTPHPPCAPLKELASSALPAPPHPASPPPAPTRSALPLLPWGRGPRVRGGFAVHRGHPVWQSLSGLWGFGGHMG